MKPIQGSFLDHYERPDVEVLMSLDTLEFLATELPEGDGVTRSVWDLIARVKEAS